MTIEGKDAKEHTCDVAKDAKITCDGKECKLGDLKKGVKVAGGTLAEVTAEIEAARLDAR